MQALTCVDCLSLYTVPPRRALCSNDFYSRLCRLFLCHALSKEIFSIICYCCPESGWYSRPISVI